MSHDDAMFFETVARALGERVCRIRQRGFTIDRRDAGDDESDLIDLAASGWIDWDHQDDVRPYRRRKPLKIA